MQNNRLAAKVAAQNKVNALANEFRFEARRLFSSYLGKKVITAQDTLTVRARETAEAIRKVLIKRNNLVSLDVWHGRSNYSLRFTLRVAESVGDDSVVYAEQEAFIGEIVGHDLTSIGTDAREYQTNYTVEAVLAARAKVGEAQDALREATAQCYPFGLGDR